jgi:uncharacterized protein YggE
MNEATIEAVREMSKPVRFAATAALAVLALFLAAKAIDAFGNIGRTTNPYQTTIMVEGTGEATAIPDVARVTFSVTESATTVAEAQTAATEKTDTALAAMKELGVEDKDLKTLSYNVYPKYEYQNPCYSGACPPAREPRITGYEVSQSVQVTVRDTAKAGEVLQALGTTEVQNISGPTFTVDDADAVKAEARDMAIAEAKEKAKKLAKELGVSLGSVVSFYENNYGGYPMYDSYGYGGEGMPMDTKAPTLPTGEQETSITVSITYEIR